MYANISICKIFKKSYSPAQIRADKQDANGTFSFSVELKHKGKYEWLWMWFHVCVFQILRERIFIFYSLRKNCFPQGTLKLTYFF